MWLIVVPVPVPMFIVLFFICFSMIVLFIFAISFMFMKSRVCSPVEVRVILVLLWMFLQSDGIMWLFFAVLPGP